MKEMYAHELEGQIVIIETVPDKEGKRRPAGYMMQVRLEETGLVLSNVTQVNISPMPITPNTIIKAEITLCHDHGMDSATYETMTIHNPKLSFAAFVEKEHHI